MIHIQKDDSLSVYLVLSQTSKNAMSFLLLLIIIIIIGEEGRTGFARSEKGWGER
jgi:hypothetical protein